ncbi:uncharacterized protein JCM6883_006760 [Sporobolomyces salmoneus]|uniref:uncharacterized protein n=1 Tax=Sporobolomyces salmoneus TaxID=183962 RepID=UPI0031768401
MLFPVLAPAISASSSHSDSSQLVVSPTRPISRKRLSFPLLSNSESTDSSTSGASPSPRSLSNWFNVLKRRNSDDRAELEAKLVKSCHKLDRKEREKREKANKKMEKEQRARSRRERDARAYAAWIEEQKLYYSPNGEKQDEKRRDQDEFFPHGVWTGAYLF